MSAAPTLDASLDATLDGATPVAPAGTGMRIPSVWLVAGGGWIGRGIQVVAQLVAVRILIGSLGTQGYGVFAVLASLNGWMLLGDFSLGISMQNYISERRASESETDDIILTGALLALAAASIIGVTLLALGPWLARWLLGGFGFLSPADRTLAFYAMVLPGIGTALGGVMYRVWFAQHRGYLSNLVPAAGTVLGTAAIWVLSRTGGGSRIAASTAAYYAPLAVLPMLALAVVVARAARRHHIERAMVRPLLSRALNFWISGLLAAGVLQVDYIVMAHVLPVHDIVIYSVATKLFFLIFFVYNALLLALWPVCSEALARHDWAAVGALVRKYIAIGVAFTIAAGLGVALTNHWIVRILAPGLDTPIPLLLIGLLTLYTMVRVWTDMFGTVLQSMNDIRSLWYVAVAQTALSIGLQTLGARYFGLSGMIVGLTACYVLTAAWVLPLRCRWHARIVAPADQGS